ncbi:TetR/AcrR family transcriptional regulator [Pseudoclavibacter sp. RFBG4]|nr:TetR/AcrR family transcriptional regulator [Pseudoclavibacter sp. RFBG4]
MTTPPVGSVSHSPIVVSPVRGCALEVIVVPAFCSVRRARARGERGPRWRQCRIEGTGQHCPVYAIPVSTPAKANRGPSAGPENRRALIAAAREIFGEGGVDAPLSAVAKRAGVGQGSLYRHFPDRASLALAVFGDAIIELEDLAASPEADLAGMLELIARQMLVSVGLIQLTLTDTADAQGASVRGRMLAVLGTVLEREWASGRVDREIGRDDLLLLLSMLAGVLPRTPLGEREAVVRRALELFWRSFAS